MPMNYPITELYAWIIDDPTETHGIVAFELSVGLAQAVTSKPHIADMMRPSAQAAGQALGLPVKLQRFVLAETMIQYP